MYAKLELMGKGLIALGWFVVASVNLLTWTAQVRESRRSSEE